MNRPQLYSKYSDLQKTDNTYVLEKFLDTSRFKDEDRILDVGCGDGNFSVECLIPKLPQNFKNFVACDVSEKMLDFARTKYFLPKIKFVALDIGAEEIPEEFENSFNHIYSFYTMHWVRRQRKAFKNIYKMLAPGGDILFTFLANSSLYDIYQNMSKHERWSQHSVKEYISPYHNLKHPEKRLEKLLQDIGFEVKVCKLVTRSFLFPSMEIFKNTITAVNPIVQKLHPDEVEEYNAGFLNEMKGMKSVIIENVNNNGEKTIREIHQIFILVATKPQNKKSDTSKLE